MAENKLSEAIEAFGKADKKNIKSIKSGDKIYKPDDYGQVTIGGISGGDDSGGDVDPHPSIGADYYPGSLADGEITERYLLYQRDESLAEDPSKPKTVTLLRDVGTKFNMAGDGATFLAHIQKTAMTAGTKGEVSDIELNFDENNSAKKGYFTTTTYYPFYIKTADLATTNELDIPIEGIGESLDGKNFLAPHLKVKFNGDGTMTLTSVTGYDNDGNSTGATGANYEIVVDVVATFSVQNAVAQMPSSINFFTGSASGEIALAGISDFFENSMDGIEITMDNYMYWYNQETSLTTPVRRIKSSNIILSNMFKISKEKLIDGINIKIILKPFLDSKSKKTIPYEGNKSNNGGVVWGDVSGSNYNFNSIKKSNIIIGKPSLNSDFEVTFKYTTTSESYIFKWNVLKISPYKN